MRRWIVMLGLFLSTSAQAGVLDTRIASIDGGYLDLSEWRGQPVLVVNTASQCGFTPQYRQLQTLHDRYAEDGLVVLAIPSDDFNQELSDAEAVKEFCDISFGLETPMADISHVKGPDAHPFYRAVAAETGFAPNWNFNKVFVGRDGLVKKTWRANTKPLSRSVLRVIEGELAERE